MYLLRQAYAEFVRLPLRWRTLGSNRFDFVCVSQGTAFDQIYNIEMARYISKTRTPYGVVCQHSYEHCWFLNEMRREAAVGFYNHAKWVAFVAERNRQMVEANLGHRLPLSTVVRNPVNLPERTVVEWPKLDSPVKFANVARLESSIKGQDILLQALSGKEWTSRDWELTLYGAGPDENYLKRLAKMLGIEDKVKFAGHVSNIRQVWAENHVLLMASRSEGTPLSLVEAMLCGRPSVVTDVGGNCEYVKHCETGFVAECPSPNSFFAALELAWNNREKWATIGRRAHEAASRLIDPNPGDSLLDLIEKMGTKRS